MDTLPAGVTFVSATGGGTLSGKCGDLARDRDACERERSQGYSVTVTAPATGVLTNIVASTSSTGDPDPSNNNGSAPGARVTTTVIEQADVATTKTGPATVTQRQNFSYTLTVANSGPSTAAAVVVTDTLPAGVTFVSATGGGTVSGNVVTWPAIASLAEWCEPGLRRDGDSAGDWHAAQYRGQHVHHRRSQPGATTMDPPPAAGSPRR